MSSKVTIVEVGMRDGLQNESVNLSQAQRFEFANLLVASGFKRIEAGSFVSPQRVPQMAKSKELIDQLLKAQKQKKIPGDVIFSALVPNEQGYLAARSVGVKEVAVFGAASETFSQKNINCSIDESLAKFRHVVALAKRDGVRVRGYVSTVFGCPYEGKIKITKALKVIEKFFDLGIFELSIGDTIGVATPKQVSELLKGLRSMRVMKKVAMHFHDTRGTAVANIAESLNSDVRVFDSSLGGLGGCPYAPGAAGNVATEDVVYLLEGMGLKTNLNFDEILKTTSWMAKQLNRPLTSRLSKAGRSCIF